MAEAASTNNQQDADSDGGYDDFCISLLAALKIGGSTQVAQFARALLARLQSVCTETWPPPQKLLHALPLYAYSVHDVRHILMLCLRFSIPKPPLAHVAAALFRAIASKGTDATATTAAEGLELSGAMFMASDAQPSERYAALKLALAYSSYTLRSVRLARVTYDSLRSAGQVYDRLDQRIFRCLDAALSQPSVDAKEHDAFWRIEAVAGDLRRMRPLPCECSEAVAHLARGDLLKFWRSTAGLRRRMPRERTASRFFERLLTRSMRAAAVSLATISAPNRPLTRARCL